jgi:hypothetical protein
MIKELNAKLQICIRVKEIYLKIFENAFFYNSGQVRVRAQERHQGL